MNIETAATTKAIKKSEEKHTIAIVGAGFAGYRFFAESLHNTIDQGLESAVRYVIIDPRPVEEYGCGVAWNGAQSESLKANMHSTSIVFDAKGDQLLLETVSNAEKEPIPLGKLFASRKEIGQIIHAAFLEAISVATTKGVEFHLLETRVKSIQRAGRGYSISLLNDGSLIADSVVLGPGHFGPGTHKHLHQKEGFIASPWQWSKLEEIDPCSEVALVGVGPTAIDALLVMYERHEAQIHAFSRSGLTQYPRPRPVDAKLKLLSTEFLYALAKSTGGLKVDVIIGIIAAEFEVQGIEWRLFEEAIKYSKRPPSEALRQGLAKSNDQAAWFGLLVEIEQLLPLMWHLLNDTERDRFRREFRAISSIVYGMAPPQAMRVIDALDNERLEIYSGYQSVEWAEGDKKFVVSYNNTGQKKGKSMKFDVVIDCTGFGSNLSDCPWLFVEPMIADGLMFKHSGGGALADFESGQLQDEDRRPVGEIYCLVGSLMIGEHFATNGLGKVAKSAHRTALAIHKKLHAQMRTTDPDWP